MAVITLKTTLKDAEARVSELKHADIRPATMGIKVGDTVKYEVWWNKKRIPHSIDACRYEVTYVERHDPRIMADHMLMEMRKIVPRYE